MVVAYNVSCFPLELPTSASWWGWLFDGMSGDWVPYTQSEKDLSIVSEKGLLIEVGTGDSYRSSDYRSSKPMMESKPSDNSQTSALKIILQN